MPSAFRNNLIFTLFVTGILVISSGCTPITRNAKRQPGKCGPGQQLFAVNMPTLSVPDVQKPDPVFHDPSPTAIGRLRPGDVFSFKVLGTDIHSKLEVSLAGTISLPFLGENGSETIELVEGKTPEKFKQYLQNRYETIVNNPVIFLVQETLSKRIAYVVGLKIPQNTIEINEKSTLLSVLSTAKWSPGWDGDTAVVFREGYARKIWLPHIYQEGITRENIRILPNDVINIAPRRGIDATGAVSNPGLHFPDREIPLTNFLISIGGISPNACLSCVRIFRPDGSEIIVDLSLPHEDVPTVTDGDMVFVPGRRLVPVYMTGEVTTRSMIMLPEGLRLSQALAINPPQQFGAAVDKTSVLLNDGSAVSTDSGALLSGDMNQPDPFIGKGTMVYIPATRTLKAINFLEALAAVIIPPPVELEAKYKGYESNYTNKRTVRPKEVQPDKPVLVGDRKDPSGSDSQYKGYSSDRRKNSSKIKPVKPDASTRLRDQKK